MSMNIQFNGPLRTPTTRILPARKLCGLALLVSIACVAAPSASTAKRQPASPRAQAKIVNGDGFRIERDIDYLGAGRNEKADLYLPTRSAPNELRPAVVIIHGGGWMGGDKGATRELNIGTNLALNGYIGLSINYALSTQRHRDVAAEPLRLQDRGALAAQERRTAAH